DGVGHEAADRVEGLAVHHRDEIVGAGDRIHRGHRGARALDLGQRLLHVLGLARRGLDQHVSLHRRLLCQRKIHQPASTAAAAATAPATRRKLVRKNRMEKNGERRSAGRSRPSSRPSTTVMASVISTSVVTRANAGSASAGCPMYPSPPLRRAWFGGSRSVTE